MKKTTYQWTNRSEHYASVTDIAELIRRLSAVVPSARNFESEHARPYDGVAKAVIESSFRALQAELHALIQGYVGKKSGRRGSHRCWPYALPVEEDTPR